jgi:hypothetical protein
LNDEVIDVADVINNQYILREVQSHEVKNLVILEIALLVTESFIQTWHARLDHLGYENVIKMKNLVSDIDFIDLKSKEICGACMKGRQERIINRTSRTRKTKFLNIIHSNLEDPLSLTRKEKMHYITFKDDWSESIWVKLLKTKSQAFNTFKAWKTRVEKISTCKIKTLRSDDERKYVSHAFQNFLKEEDIYFDDRVSYVPEQNEKAKRLNRILFYKIRSIMTERKILKGLWDEVLKSAVYLTNRSLESDDITSFEKVKDIKPDLSHLKIIEFRAWVQILKKKRKKLNDRFWQSIFIDYEMFNNQFRLYDLKSERIQIARDVIVDESNEYDYKEDNLNFWIENDDQFLNSSADDIDDELISQSIRPLHHESFDSVKEMRLESSDSVRDMFRNTEIVDQSDEDNQSNDNDSNDHDENAVAAEELASASASRKSRRLRKAFKLTERMIEYDSKRKTILRINLVSEKDEDLFSYKKILKCYDHMIRILITLTKENQSHAELNESIDLKEAKSRSNW